jgi:hypothetical protein
MPNGNEATVTFHAEPVLYCDECGAVEHDLTKLAEWHAGCPRAGVLRLRAMAEGPSAPLPEPSIDSVLSQLEDEMHYHCDQPLKVDAMSLTRGWREILTQYRDALASALSERKEA